LLDTCTSSTTTGSLDEKQFLSVFYENYAEWLVAPFQFQILRPAHSIPTHILHNQLQSECMQDMVLNPFRKGLVPDKNYVVDVVDCCIRRSFAVELLSFCVRAHTYRIKFFLLRSKVIGSVMRLLRPSEDRGISNSRALKLAVLRFLRAIISANDEFYHRHIVQNDLFAAVFEALRTNPVEDNLLSSAIVEMCDFIYKENIVSLVDYIVTNFLIIQKGAGQSNEGDSSSHGSTLRMLRRTFEATLNELRKSDRHENPLTGGADEPIVSPRQQQSHRQLSGRALADQRKFQELDHEESYFESDDELEQHDKRNGNGAQVTVDDEQRQQAVENELHRTPRMFSLAQTSLLQDDEGQKDMKSPQPHLLHQEEGDTSDNSPPTI
jgi:hypothetical protein